MILNEIPLLLTKENIVVEVLERVKVTEKIIKTCSQLKDKVNIIALDDFVFSQSYLPIIELTDIIKIEFSAISFEEQYRLINKFSGKIKFLAEKVETREEYEKVVGIGYDNFQVYFFSKSVIMIVNEIDSLNTNLIKIIDQLNKEGPQFQNITEVIETDLELSYKLLKPASSIFFGSRSEIHSIKLKLVILGVVEIRILAYLMVLRDLQYRV